MPQQIRVKDEDAFRLDWKTKGNAVRQLRTIEVLSLPTLQALYLRYYKEDASECEDTRLLIRKLQYWFQHKYYTFHQTPISSKFRRRMDEMMALSLIPEGDEEDTVGKKSTRAAEVEVEEELEEDDDTTEEVEEEEDEAEEADDDEAPAATSEKRKAPAKTGDSIKVVKLKGEKFKGRYIYEILVQMYKANRKLKATDEEFASAIRATWAGTGVNYETYRVRADRVKYNKGGFKGQEGAPEKLSREYDSEGNVMVREIPKQLRPFVTKGQPVAKTIAENKAKGLIKKKAKLTETEDEDDE